MKIVLEGFNEKVGREDIFKPTTGNVSSLKISIDNGTGVVNFATSKNFTVESKRLPYRNFHIFIRTSSDGKTHNQIDIFW
jgi:hypothetical protein